MENLSHDELMKFAKFSSKFICNLNLLKRRINKFLSLPKISKTQEEECEWFTYYDAILVQVRALLIESKSRKKNYTLQNYLRLLNREKIADILDAYLDSDFDDEVVDKDTGKPLSIRSVIKFVADKFICHYDYTEDVDVILENKISKILTNLDCYEKNNIHKILLIIVDIMKKLENVDWSKIK